MRRTHLVNANLKDGAFKEGTINTMTRQRFQTVLKPYIKHKIKGILNHCSLLSPLHIFSF
jgi:hypothetical protein